MVFSPARRDLLCALILAALGLFLRVGSLDRVSLNPDESQYEATASYLVATGASPFLPYGTPGTFVLFKLMTVLFGPYPMYETRLLFLVVAVGMALLLFRLVGRETNRACGLVSGLVFLHYAMAYEGLTVNREWFAALMSLGGVALYTLARGRPARSRYALLIASGLISGLALLFKLQASFIVLVIPLLLLYEATDGSRLRRTLSAHLFGGLLAGVVYLLPFQLAGTLAEFMGFVLADWNVFVVGNEQAIQESSGGALSLYFGRFYADQPHRVLLLVAYGLALSSLFAVGARLLWRRGRKPSGLARPGIVVFAVYLLAAMLCVKLGNRFFGHYYLLMMPPVAGLAGFAVHYFATDSKRSRWGQALGWSLLGVFLLDRVLALQPHSPGEILAAWPASALLVAYVLAGLLLLAYGLVHWPGRGGPTLAALILLEVGLLVFNQQRLETPASMSHSPFRLERLVQFLEQRSEPGDRLFVWGWAPEIYSLTRLESASHITSCQYVVNDYLAGPERPSLNREWAEMVMQDLRWRQPRFIVDAAMRSWTSTEPWVYRLEHYPEFALGEFLRSDYVSLGEYDECEVFERRRP